MTPALASQLKDLATRAELAAEAVRGFLAAHAEPGAPAPSTGVPEPERFKRCLTELLKHEGGYVDHPRDPGGATNLGVTLATLREWRGKTVTKADVKALTVEEAGAIYRAKYWVVAGCDRLPAGVDLIVFDMAVNSGPARAVRTLQQVVNVTPDGVVGPVTLTAARAKPAAELIDAYSRKREAFYRSLSTFDTFGRGWMRRLNDVTETARSWA